MRWAGTHREAVKAHLGARARAQVHLASKVPLYFLWEGEGVPWQGRRSREARGHPSGRGYEDVEEGAPQTLG